MNLNVIYCTACGAKNKASHRFCYSCGAEIFNEAVELPESEPEQGLEKATPAVSSETLSEQGVDSPQPVWGATPPASPSVAPSTMMNTWNTRPEEDQKNAAHSGLMWLSLAVFIISLIFAAYKLYQYSTWIYVGREDWLTLGIAGGVALLALVGVVVFSKRPSGTQAQTERGIPLPPSQEEKKKSTRRFFLWLSLIVFIASLIFGAYKLYQYSTWIYISQEDWLFFGAIIGIVIASFAGIIILSKPTKKAVLPGQRTFPPFSETIYIPSAPANSPAAFDPGSTARAVGAVATPVFAKATEPAAKKSSAMSWIGAIAALALGGAAIGLAVDALSNGSGGDLLGNDPCAEVRDHLEDWNNCDCSHTSTINGYKDMVSCDVTARMDEYNYTDQNGMQMHVGKEGQGYVPLKCVQTEPQKCKNR